MQEGSIGMCAILCASSSTFVLAPVRANDDCRRYQLTLSTSTVREEHNRNNSLPVSGLISASGLYHQAPDLYVGYSPRLAPSSQTQECRIGQ